MVKRLKSEQTYTIIKGSELEFNIRWWGMGISMMVFGLIVGSIIPW